MQYEVMQTKSQTIQYFTSLSKSAPERRKAATDRCEASVLVKAGANFFGLSTRTAGSTRFAGSTFTASLGAAASTLNDPDDLAASAIAVSTCGAGDARS